jgi:hypothetical protein
VQRSDNAAILASIEITFVSGENCFIVGSRHYIEIDNVVESADNLTILSSIAIIWCSGKNCWVVGTCHITIYLQQQQADRFDADDDMESAYA